LHIIDVREEFSKKVIADFINKHKEGKTPNPCVVCNKQVKFKELISLADNLGISKVATGHYVRKIKIATRLKDGKIKTRWFIKRAKDIFKDQSYFLCKLNSATIQRCKFPLGEYLEKEVQLIAHKSDYLVLRKKIAVRGCVFCKVQPLIFLNNILLKSQEILLIKINKSLENIKD